MDKKHQVHISTILMMEECGERARRRYGKDWGWNDRNEIIPPGIALMVGIGTHYTVQKNLGNKILTGELLPIEQICDLAWDSITGLWQGEVRLIEDEVQDIKKVKGESIDMTIALSKLHATDLAPKLQPKSVERKWVINLEKYPYDLAGRIDIEEPNAIRDTKTAGKSPPENAANQSEQISMYALAKKVCDGAIPEKMYLDSLVKTKTKTPKVVIQETNRTDQDMQALFHRIERAFLIIEKGAFMPARADWWGCSPRWCGYHSSCPFAVHPKTI